jgi:hypothetical protein
VEIEDHYGLLLGINSPWENSSVDVDLATQKVDVIIEYIAARRLGIDIMNNITQTSSILGFQDLVSGLQKGSSNKFIAAFRSISESANNTQRELALAKNAELPTNILQANNFSEEIQKILDGGLPAAFGGMARDMPLGNDLNSGKPEFDFDKNEIILDDQGRKIVLDYGEEIEDDLLRKTGEILEDLVQDSPAFREAVLAAMDAAGTESFSIKFFEFASNTNAGAFTNLGTLVAISPGYVRDTSSEQVARTIVHELAHFDPLDYYHGPQQSQFVAGVMRQYLAEKNLESIDDVEKRDYSIDSFFEREKILDEYSVGDESLRTIYERVLVNLEANDFSAVSNDLILLKNSGVIINEEYENPQTDADFDIIYSIPVDEWVSDLLVYESFDTQIGGQDYNQRENDLLLRTALNAFYEHLETENLDDIIGMLSQSGEKFFLDFPLDGAVSTDNSLSFPLSDDDLKFWAEYFTDDGAGELGKDDLTQLLAQVRDYTEFQAFELARIMIEDFGGEDGKLNWMELKGVLEYLNDQDIQFEDGSRFVLQGTREFEGGDLTNLSFENDLQLKIWVNTFSEVIDGLEATSTGELNEQQLSRFYSSNVGLGLSEERAQALASQHIDRFGGDSGTLNWVDLQAALSDMEGHYGGELDAENHQLEQETLERIREDAPL